MAHQAMSISNDDTGIKFRNGDYLTVALSGDETDWRTHAARGLIGPEKGHAERLSAFDGEEENFYRAVLYWMDCDEKTAISILERSTLPAAQRLLQILGAPKIKIISQMIEDSPSPFALFRGISCDERFEVTNIDFRPRPGRPTPSANLIDYLDPSDPPVFFTSTMVEWNPLPDKLEHLNCPIFGCTHDYDMAFQTVQPLLQRFDELIVLGAEEKTAIERLTGKQAIVYPNVSALDDADLPKLSQLRSDTVNIDVIMTGTTVDYFYPDKRDFLSRLLKCQHLEPLIIHGFLPKKFYFQLSRQAQIIISLNRFTNRTIGVGIETRFLEALAVGRPIFSLRGSDLGRLASEFNEIYHFEKNGESIELNLTNAITREKLKPIDREATAKRFRQLYGHQNIGSRYLRFLTFRASMNEGLKRNVEHDPPIYQRVTGWTGFPKVAVDLQQKTMATLAKKCQNADDWHSRLTAAREFILSAAEAGRKRPSPDSISQTLNRGANLLREIILMRPHVLAARFNLIRALLHLGAELDRIEAINLLNDTLEKPSDRWELGQLDHVMPFDFFPHMFDYRSYLHSLANLGGGIEEQNRRKSMILSSLHAYRGWFDGNALDFHEAKRLNPDFIHYSLWSARADMTNGDWSNVEKLRADLEAASFDPLTSQQATHLLWTFKDKLYEKGKVPQELADFADRNERYLLYVGVPEGDRGSIYESGWHLPGNAFNYQYNFVKPTEVNIDILLTVIIAPRPRRDYRSLLNSLAAQTLNRNKFSIIWAEPFAVPPNDPSNIIDEVICCGQMGVFDHLNQCYNLALSRVVAPIVLIVDETTPLPNTLLALILETFINAADGPLIVTTENCNSKATILENMLLYQESTIAFRVADLIAVGGFDEAPSFHGLLSGPFDAAHRIALGPCNLATIDTANRQEKKRRSYHTFVTEYLVSLYGAGRTLPYVEHESLRKLRVQSQK